MSRLTALSAALLVALLLALLAPSQAYAHTALESSSPADGETVAGPLAEVVLTFTQPVSPIDGGLAVAGSDGATYVPTVTADGARLVAAFEPALEAGAYTLAWQARSSDTHVIDGAFSFAVTVEAPPSTSQASSAAPTTAAVPGGTPSSTVASSAPPTTAAVEGDAVAPAPSPEPPASSSPSASRSPSPPAAPELSDAGDGGTSAGDLGRLLAFPAAVLALGMLVFAATAFAGRSADLGATGRTVRVLAAVVVVGSLIELFGLRDSIGSWSTVFDGSTGRAVLVRALGALAIAAGIGRLAPTVRPSLSAAVAAPDRAVAAVDPRWRPGMANALGLLGAGVVLVSFAFDGHTVSEGPRLLHGVASVVHVAAASVWAGGVAAIALLIWRRHRSAVATAATEMTVRFSVVAMVALGAAAVAGVAMALMIDSDVAGYLDTAWGRTLLVKLVLVATGAAIGAYNHFRVLPRLRVAAEDPAVLATARRTLAVEAAALIAAAAISGLLVAASTV